MEDFFFKILRNLRSKSQSLVYHSQFALRKISNTNPSLFFLKIGEYLKQEKRLERRVIIELTNAFQNINTNDDTYIQHIHTVVSQIQNLCEYADNLTLSNEVYHMSAEIMMTKQQFIFNLLNELKESIIVMFAFSHYINSYKQLPSVQILNKLLNYECTSLYSKFALARLISTIYPFVSSLSNEMYKNVCDISKSLFSYFLDNNDILFSKYVEKLFPIIEISDESRHGIFLRLLDIIKENQSTGIYLISCVTQILNKDNDDYKDLLDALIPSLSLVPFHYTDVKPDDELVKCYNSAITSIKTIMNKDNSSLITNFIINQINEVKSDKRVGFIYALTCLINAEAPVDLELVKPLFGTVSSLLESAALSELSLSLLNNSHEIVPWTNMMNFLEECIRYSNENTVQFVFDASKVLGMSINDNSNNVFKELDDQITSKFHFAHIYYHILSSYSSKNNIFVYPPMLTLRLLLLENVFTDIKTGIDVSTLDPSIYSSACRKMLESFSSSGRFSVVLVKILTSITWNCNSKDARQNIDSIIHAYSDTFQKHIDEIAEAFAAYVYVSPQESIQYINSYVLSKSKTWYLFTSSVKSSVSVQLTFSTLTKIKSNFTQFIQFASENLPDPADVSLVEFVVDSLALIFREKNRIEKNFPPKCRLFDFLLTVCYLENDSLYRCIGELISIPPIYHTEHIPVVTNLIKKANVISDDLIYMLSRTLEIVDTAEYIVLIIRPFDALDVSSIHFQIFLSILNSFAPRKYSKIDFPIIEYDASKHLDNVASNSEVILALIAELVGIYLPMFAETHLVIEYVLSIMAKLTHKGGVRANLSLQEAVKNISTTFNSQCLVITSGLLCENITVHSVTSFLILFEDRENELLQSVYNFCSNLLDKHIEIYPMLFNSNETLTRAAVSILTTSDVHFKLLKKSLKITPYKQPILNTLIEKNIELLVMVISDQSLIKIFDHSLPEVQFALIMSENGKFDIDKLSDDNKVRLIELIENNLSKMGHTQLIRSVQASALTNIEKSINVFESYFYCSDCFQIIEPFVKNLNLLPKLLKVARNKHLLCTVIAIALKNQNTLPLIDHSLPKVFSWVIRFQKLVILLHKQDNVELLKPLLPIVVSNAYDEHEELQKELLTLLSKVVNKNFTPPMSFANLIEQCEQCEFSEVNPMVIEQMMARLRKGHLPTLVVLSYLCQEFLIDRDNYNIIIAVIKSRFNESDLNVQEAVVVSSSCFPFTCFLQNNVHQNET